MPHRLSAALAVLLLSCPGTVAAEPAKYPKYLGAATCASSHCHGSPTAKNGSNVLQNEYFLWHKHGRHSQAWKTLLNEESKQIGKHLGIAAPEKDPLCLACHTTYVADSKQRGEKFTVEDGVGCESCHGAAEHWISSHTKRGATHRENVERGLTDLVPLDTRARLCLTCHYGTDDQTVNHKLIGSGHPRLAFELDTFSMIQPPHWRYDTDYTARKGEYIAAKAWLIGQVVLASEQMAALLSEKRSKDESWPELTLFTCYSCHHSLTSDQWKKRDYGRYPGELQLNTSSLRVVIPALQAVSSKLSKQLNALVEELHRKVKGGDGGHHVQKIKQLLDGAILPAVTKFRYNDENLGKLLAAVHSAALRPHLHYEEAEQLLMAITAVIESSETLREKYKRSLETLYETTKNPEEFVAEDFTAAVKQLRIRSS